MSLVLDSSITLAWFFEDERTDAVTSVLRQVVDDWAIVPSLWRYEIANGLEMAVRRGRIDRAYRDRILGITGRGLARKPRARHHGHPRKPELSAGDVGVAGSDRLEPLLVAHRPRACPHRLAGIPFPSYRKHP